MGELKFQSSVGYVATQFQGERKIIKWLVCFALSLDSLTGNM